METEDDKGTGWSNGMCTNINWVLNSFFLSVWYWHHGGIRTRPATLNHHHCLAITIFWISVKQDKLPGAIIVIFHPKNNDVCIYFIYGRMIESKEKERESCRCGFTIQYFFIKRLVSKEIVLLHRGQLYNQESAIRTWNHGKSGI